MHGRAAVQPPQRAFTPSTLLVSRRVDFPNQATNPPNIQSFKQAYKGQGYPLPTLSMPVRPAGLILYSGLFVVPLTFKVLPKNEYNLFMDPLGFDQSRHVDDVGAKKHHFDDFATKKIVMWASFL